VKSIILLRATLTKTVLMTDPNRLTKAGKEELTDLVYASVELSAGMGEAPAFGEVREVSEKLNEKLPGVRLLQKALFVARINLWKVYKDTMTYPEQSRFWEENKALLERGRILGLPEKDLKSMEFALETRGFEPALVKKHADQLKGSAESEARKAFLTAFQMWRQAEAGTAMEQIRNAIQLAPNDPVYLEVFRELSVPGAGEEVFLKVLNVDLSPADFENL
jgi:hypothetical protein